MYVLVVDFPPSLNSYYIHFSRKNSSRVFKGVSKRGQRFKDGVIAKCIDQKLYGLKLQSRLSVEVILHPPDRRKYDLDNYQKGLFDAITDAGLWVDDSQIDKMMVFRGETVPKSKSRAIVVIKEIEEDLFKFNYEDYGEWLN